MKIINAMKKLISCILALTVFSCNVFSQETIRLHDVNDTNYYSLSGVTAKAEEAGFKSWELFVYALTEYWGYSYYNMTYVGVDPYQMTFDYVDFHGMVLSEDGNKYYVSKKFTPKEADEFFTPRSPYYKN